MANQKRKEHLTSCNTYDMNALGLDRSGALHRVWELIRDQKPQLMTEPVLVFKEGALGVNNKAMLKEGLLSEANKQRLYYLSLLTPESNQQAFTSGQTSAQDNPRLSVIRQRIADTQRIIDHVDEVLEKIYLDAPAHPSTPDKYSLPSSGSSGYSTTHLLKLFMGKALRQYPTQPGQHNIPRDIADLLDDPHLCIVPLPEEHLKDGYYYMGGADGKINWVTTLHDDVIHDALVQNEEKQLIFNLLHLGETLLPFLFTSNHLIQILNPRNNAHAQEAFQEMVDTPGLFNTQAKPSEMSNEAKAYLLTEMYALYHFHGRKRFQESLENNPDLPKLVSLFKTMDTAVHTMAEEKRRQRPMLIDTSGRGPTRNFLGGSGTITVGMGISAIPLADTLSFKGKKVISGKGGLFSARSAGERTILQDAGGSKPVPDVILAKVTRDSHDLSISPDQFNPGDRLSQHAKDFFGTLNQVLTKLKVSPAEFETAFTTAAKNQSTSFALSAVRQGIVNNGDKRKAPEQVAGIDQCTVISPRIRPRNKKADMSTSENNITIAWGKMDGGLAAAMHPIISTLDLNQLRATSKLGTKSTGDSHQKAQFQGIIDTLEASDTSISLCENDPMVNMHLYAAGKRLFNNLGKTIEVKADTPDWYVKGAVRMSDVFTKSYHFGHPCCPCCCGATNLICLVYTFNGLCAILI